MFKEHVDVEVPVVPKTDHRSGSDTDVLTSSWDQDGNLWRRNDFIAQTTKQENQEVHYSPELVRKYQTFEAARMSRDREFEGPRRTGECRNQHKTEMKVQDTDSWVEATTGWAVLRTPPSTPEKNVDRFSPDSLEARVPAASVAPTIPITICSTSAALGQDFKGSPSAAMAPHLKVTIPSGTTAVSDMRFSRGSRGSLGASSNGLCGPCALPLNNPIAATLKVDPKTPEVNSTGDQRSREVQQPAPIESSPNSPGSAAGQEVRRKADS